MDTGYFSPIDIDGISKRKQEGAFICSPISDNRVSRFEQEEEGDVLGAAKWLVAAPFVAIVVGLVLAVVVR